MKLDITKAKTLIKHNLKWIILVIMILICFELTEELFDKDLIIFDKVAYDVIFLFNNNYITNFFKIVTDFFGIYLIAAILVLSFVFIKDKKYSLVMLINLALITGLNVFFKNIFERPRPEGFRLIEASGYSFPSGHSMISMGFYGLIIYFIYKNIKNKNIKWISISVISLVILITGISRIYLGVHYASDVLQGFCMAIVYLISFINIIHINKIFKKE